MSARKSIARTTTPNYVTTTKDGITWSLSRQSMINGHLIDSDIFKCGKSKLYSLLASLVKKATEKGITEIDAGFGQSFHVIYYNNEWYQMQSIKTPKENLILPDFRETDIYKQYMAK